MRIPIQKAEPKHIERHTTTPVISITPVSTEPCMLPELEFRVSAALSAPSGVKFFVACCHFRVTARPRSGRAL